MARYDYECPFHGIVEVQKSMSEAGREETCPRCHADMTRVYAAPPVHYHADGFYATDYFKSNAFAGTKAEHHRKQYKKQYGEEAPPPAPDVRRSGGEVH